jgi:exonuclease 3'-5' domain-containing protein 1
LLQYPSLFIVDGEYVNVNCFQIRDKGVTSTKDYNQEAIEYFSQKLLQYGAGTEVPIKSLLGHRSQASPQVRHISGQHIKEFADFLAKHPDTFHVVDDHVTLINYDSATVIPASEKLHLPQPSIDVKQTQQILDFFAQCIEVKGPILVDQLFHLVTSNFSQEYWFRIFKTPSDLTAFLKLFSDCFYIQSNLVTLLQKPKINENHVQHAQKVLSKNNSIPDFKLNEPVSNNIMLMMGDSHKNNNNNNNNTTHTVATSKSGSPSLNDSLSNGRNSNNDLPSIGLPQSFLDLKLENLCTRNCPSKFAVPQNINSFMQQQPLENNNNNNNFHQPLQSIHLQVKGEREKRVNLTLKQRINNLVTKTLAENEEKDKRFNSNLTTTLTNGNVSSSSNSSSTTTSPIHTRNSFTGETWKIRVLQNTRVITSIKESLFVCEAIRKSGMADECPIISFDCEGVNLGAKGELTIVEIGTVRGEAFIFDLKACAELMNDGGLKGILEDESIIKIIHDCRNDSYNLYAQFNVLLRNVFDTQVSNLIVLQTLTTFLNFQIFQSAHAVLQYQEQGKQVYKVKNVSLNTLCDMYHVQHNPMKEQLKNIYKRDPKYWSRRPLTRDMLLYAASDVLVLINEQLFRTMSS